jgi:hypothetical protein
MVTASPCLVVMLDDEGVTVTVGVVIAGVVKLAVTVVSARKVTAHVTEATDVHPDHEEKVLWPDRAGAVSAKEAPVL